MPSNMDFFFLKKKKIAKFSLLFIVKLLLLVSTRILVDFYLIHINGAWFILWISDVFQFVPTGLTFMMS